MDKESPCQTFNKDLIFLEESLEEEALQDNIAEEVLEDLDKVAKDLLRE